MAKPLATLPIYQATGFWSRFYGWHRFAHPEALLYFASCKAVHGIGLTQPLWVLFVDKKGVPLGQWRCLEPNRLLWCAKAAGVIECQAPIEKRRQYLAAFTHLAWQAQLRPWRLRCFGRRRCGK